MTEKRELLFDQFPPVSTEEWRAKVETDLKGAPFDKKLVWRTNEGFNVQPMYRAEDIKDLKTTDSLPGEFPYVRGTRTDNDWLSRQEIIAPSAEEANKVALDVLMKGINSLGFKINEGTADELKTLLNEIEPTAVELNFTCCPKHALEFAATLVAYIKERGIEKEFNGSIDFNPFRKALKHGVEFPGDIAEMGVKLLEIVKDVPCLKVLAVDSMMLSNAGAYIYQELGYALAWGAEWLTLLTEKGVEAAEVARRIKFNMGVSSNYFMELAKFRAARMLWAQIVKQYGVDNADCKMAVHAVTSRFNQTIYDAYVNLLRSQTECMSAALAGVDSITVTPFDTPYKTPDDFSERIARNQQFLLKEESHLDKVVDPAGGSYYVETLTVAIAQQAWKVFLEVEETGGFLANVNNGTVQKVITETSEKRHTDVARRKEILLGTNQYPNINEMAAEKIEIKGAGCGCGCHNGEKEEGGKGLPTARAASSFEELRLATEAASNRPKVFMLTIGNLAMRLARAQFSTNFFGCAGYEIIDNLGFETVQEGVDAALEKGADVVVLCSSDDEYATLAPEAFKYLDGRAEFVVAGSPACMDELKAQGINDYVHVRCNVLDVLRDFNNRLLK
ncbi:MAG: methylmalonyl-CoA mutase small subunit [Firmicutes bacterium]|nr:methylmalonyl-CoA mutase small subunit [Bacillota bacterium]MCM1400901.1 methylmalonyl-CoA mutase small subunit [Bacteroides sp.]MCM1476554.1 methylmalonyl-CoA mutase small subunit [Bacteroides sp.]